MVDKSAKPDAAFIERKRRQLLALKEELQGITNAAEADEGLVKGESNAQAHEYEDDAQKLDTLEKGRKRGAPRRPTADAGAARAAQDR